MYVYSTHSICFPHILSMISPVEFPARRPARCLRHLRWPSESASGRGSGASRMVLYRGSAVSTIVSIAVYGYKHLYMAVIHV